MVLTIETLKKINSAFASGEVVKTGDLIGACSLDEAILQKAVGDLEKSIPSMSAFFQTLSAYLAEMQKRVKMMGECYVAVQKVQIKQSVISVTADAQDPPIVWS